MNICLFTPDEINKPLSIRDSRGEHLIKILHKKAGDTFSAGIIGGASGTATIVSVDTWDSPVKDGKKSITEGNITFTFEETGDGKPLYPLVMIIGFPRPIQLKRLLRDMAGLGVQEIHLTATELGEKSYLKADLSKPEECYNMLLEGTVQAAGTHVPSIYMHSSLRECIIDVEQRYGTDNSLIALDNVGSKQGLTSYLMANPLVNDNGCKTAIAAIGSERGWTTAERELLTSRGYTRLSMGQRVLRTETACTVGASLILSAMGKLD